MARPIVGIMGPGGGATDQDCRYAFELGEGIAKKQWVLLTGGRCEGVMDAASRGARHAGGLVIGVLPGNNYSGISEAVDIPIVTGMGEARNVINVKSCTVVIACGMGLGTASEVALALKSSVPVVILDEDDMGYEFFRHISKLASGDRLLQKASTPKEAITLVQSLIQNL